jgi:hypothetical protein
MTPNNAAGSFSAHRPAWLYFIAVMLAYAVVVLTAKTPPHLLDYPDWVYQGVLFRGVIAGHPFPGYALKPYPVPNSLTTVGIGLLSTIFTWQVAGKLWICFYLALATFATLMLSRAFAPLHSRAIVALPAIVFLNLDFWYGHISFEIGLCLFMILVALVLRGARPVPIALLLVVIFFAHMEALACAILFILLWAVSSRQRMKLWTVAPALVLTLWYAVGRFAQGNRDAAATSVAAYSYGSKSFLIYKANTFFKSFGYVNVRAVRAPSISEAVLGKPLFVTLAVCSVVSALLVLGLIVRASFFRDSRSVQYFRVFVLILLTLSVFIPQAVLGTADPGSRLLLTAALISFLVADWRHRTGFIIAALSVIFCIANLYQFARIQHNPDLQPHAADLPAPLLTYGHVEPFMRDAYYEHLSSGEMNLQIFPTGIFVQKR